MKVFGLRSWLFAVAGVPHLQLTTRKLSSVILVGEEHQQGRKNDTIAEPVFILVTNEDE